MAWETDGLQGFMVKVARPDRIVYLASPSLSTLSDTRNWIDDHRRRAAKIKAAPRASE
jgi:hypothetical protein